MNQDHGSLTLCPKALHLSSFATHLKEMTVTAESQGWRYQQYLQHLAELELEDRNQRRIERLLKTSNLPEDKTLASLDVATLPDRVKKVLPSLCEGLFLKRSENILAFGLPGRGKTHMLCAIGHELVRRGHTVLFVPAYRLVQSLLVAKRDLNLEKKLKKLDRFEAVTFDYTYVKHPLSALNDKLHIPIERLRSMRSICESTLRGTCTWMSVSFSWMRRSKCWTPSGPTSNENTNWSRPWAKRTFWPD